MRRLRLAAGLRLRLRRSPTPNLNAGDAGVPQARRWRLGRPFTEAARVEGPLAGECQCQWASSTENLNSGQLQ